MTEEKYLEAERTQSEMSAISRAVREINKYENEKITDIAFTFGDYRTVVNIKPHYLPQINLLQLKQALLARLEVLTAKFDAL